jgi:sugar phosphate permease
VLTAGTAAYAVGKFLTGPVIDSMGGRKVRRFAHCSSSSSSSSCGLLTCPHSVQVFLLALFSSVVLTVVFTFGSSVWYFTLVWIGNRLVQAAGACWSSQPSIVHLTFD